MYELRPLPLSGCFEVIPYVYSDIRGRNMKPFHRETFKELGLTTDFDEDLIATSRKDILRGMHLQRPPHQQIKLVCCPRGEIFDVILDLRRDSPTFGKFETMRLDGERMNMLYIPQGIAHGYLVTGEDTVVCYKISGKYSTEHETGVRWDSFGAPWPVEKPIVSAKDSQLQNFSSFEGL